MIPDECIALQKPQATYTLFVPLVALHRSKATLIYLNFNEEHVRKDRRLY